MEQSSKNTNLFRTRSIQNESVKTIMTADCSAVTLLHANIAVNASVCPEFVVTIDVCLLLSEGYLVTNPVLQLVHLPAELAKLDTSRTMTQTAFGAERWSLIVAHHTWSNMFWLLWFSTNP